VRLVTIEFCCCHDIFIISLELWLALSGREARQRKPKIMLLNGLIKRLEGA